MIQAFPGDAKILFAPINYFFVAVCFTSVVMINPRVCFLVFYSSFYLSYHCLLAFLDEKLFFSLTNLKLIWNGCISLKKHERKYFVQLYSSVVEKLFLAVHHVFKNKIYNKWRNAHQIEIKCTFCRLRRFWFLTKMITIIIELFAKIKFFLILYLANLT